MTRELIGTVNGVTHGSAPASAAIPTADHASQAWLAALQSPDGRREDALRRLHELLLGAARFEIGRRRSQLAYLGDEELDVLATHAADDALMAVLRKLHTYEGKSRFTTWAYKFALLEASMKVQRRQSWRRDVPLEPDQWERKLAEQAGTPAQAEMADLLTCIKEAIRCELTPHQRHILVALTIDGVPIDALAERMSTTRGALYKTLHDARRKLRRTLDDKGLALDSALGDD